MIRNAIRLAPVAVALVASAVWVPARFGAKHRTAEHQATASGRCTPPISKGSEVLAARSDQRARNFSKLEVAWRFKTDNLGPRPENKLEGTPIMVKGMVYATAGTRRAGGGASTPRTGELKWMHSMRRGRARHALGAAPAVGPRPVLLDRRQRRRAHPLRHHRLPPGRAQRQDRRSRSRASAASGVVDLKQGVDASASKQIDLEKGEIGSTRRRPIVSDMVIVGSSMFEGLGYRYAQQRQGPRARVRREAPASRSGASTPFPARRVRQRHVGRRLVERYTGNTGVWTQITVDPEARHGLPAGRNAHHRRLRRQPPWQQPVRARALVAVDLKTGVRKWHFQLGAPPDVGPRHARRPRCCIDTNVNGKPRKLVALPSKQGWLYVFDRITGQPIWPIEEQPVPQTNMAGEKTVADAAASRPSRRPTRARTWRERPDRLHAGAAQQALDNLKNFRWEQVPVRAARFGTERLAPRIDQHRQTANGGVNWPGSGFDLETGIFYTQAGHGRRDRGELRGRGIPAGPSENAVA